jgi:hypothetical protein
MSRDPRRDPRQILDDLVAYARQFLTHEERLLDPVAPGNPFPIDERVHTIEQGFSGAAYHFFRAFNEYKARVAKLPHNPFSLPLRRAIEALPGLIESRFLRWGWDLSFLAPKGFARLCKRCQADKEARERAVDEAAVSWRTLGKDLATHHGADRAAFAAERRGVKPTMPPEQGERTYDQRVKDLWMKPMIGKTVPEVTLDEHDKLCRAVNELARLALDPASPIRDSLRACRSLAVSMTVANLRMLDGSLPRHRQPRRCRIENKPSGGEERPPCGSPGRVATIGPTATRRSAHPRQGRGYGTDAQ